MITYAVRHRRTRPLGGARVAGHGRRASTRSTPYAPEAMPGVVAGVCGRSPACHRRAPATRPATFARLAQTAAAPPGRAGSVPTRPAPPHRCHGHREPALQLLHVLQRRPLHRAPVRSLQRRPVGSPWRPGRRCLRLAADNDPAMDGFFGADLREFSNGHSLARDLRGRRAGPVRQGAHRSRVRHAQFAAAYAAEPDIVRRRSPSRPGPPPAGSASNRSPCIVVDGGRTARCTPPDTRVDGVPDARPGRGVRPARARESCRSSPTNVMVDSTYVGMTAAGHDPQFWSDCGPELAAALLSATSTSATPPAPTSRPAAGGCPGSFPTQVRKAPPAVPDQRAARVAPGPPAGHRHRVDRHGQRPAQLLRAR